MVITEEHLTMGYNLIASELNIFKKIKKFIGNKNILTNIFRIQFDNVWIFWIHYIEFIGFMHTVR